MKFVTNIIAAEDDELSAVGESTGPLDQWSGIEAPGLDSVKIATLHCLLTGDTLQMALDICEPVYVSANDTIVLRIGNDALERLAALEPEALKCVANELAATDEFEREQWLPEDALALLTELAELAQLAESQGQALFVWMLFVSA